MATGVIARGKDERDGSFHPAPDLDRRGIAASGRRAHGGIRAGCPASRATGGITAESAHEWSGPAWRRAGNAGRWRPGDAATSGSANGRRSGFPVRRESLLSRQWLGDRAVVRAELRTGGRGHADPALERQGLVQGAQPEPEPYRGTLLGERRFA